MGQRQDTIRRAGEAFQRDFLNGSFKHVHPEQQTKHYLLFALGYWGIYRGKLPTTHPQYSPFVLHGYEDCFLTGYELELAHDQDVTKSQLVVLFNEVFRNGNTSLLKKAPESKLAKKSKPGKPISQDTKDNVEAFNNTIFILLGLLTVAVTLGSLFN